MKTRIWIVFAAILFSSCQLNFNHIDVCEDPVFDPAPGTYRDAVVLTITSATPGASIHYTTDGTAPDENTTLYTGPIPLSATTRILAVATFEDANPSDNVYGDYGIGWTVETFAGTAGRPGDADGIGAAASFSQLSALTSDGSVLYAVDNNAIRSIDPATGEVVTLAGQSSISGLPDGVGTSALFNGPTGLSVADGMLYVADSGNCSIRSIDLATLEVTTFAGSTSAESGSTDGVGTAARFAGLAGLATDGAALYVCDRGNHTIRRIEIATRSVTTIAGSAGVEGSSDGTGPTALFCSPQDCLVVGAFLYVTDRACHVLRRIDPSTRVVTTVAGRALPDAYGGYLSGFSDGSVEEARLNSPSGIAWDGSSLFLCDNYSCIRRLALDPVRVTTIGGSPHEFGYADGIGAVTRFHYVTALVWFGSSLFVADKNNCIIRRMH